MKKYYLYSFFLLIFCSFLSAQEDDDAYDLNNLDYDLLKQKLSKKIKLHNSSGYFPTPIPNYFLLGIYSNDYYVYENAQNISSANFNSPANKLSGDLDFDIDDKMREFREKFSDEIDDDFPTSDYETFGIKFDYSSGLPFIFNSKFGFSNNHALLYSLDKSKKFLANNGKLKSFDELNIFHLHQWSWNLYIGLEQPIYGVFKQVSSSSFFSYYYLKLGYMMDFPFYNNVNQYLQNGNSKDELRFNNGRDYKNLSNKSFDNLMFRRDNLEMSLGWRIGSASFLSFAMEINASYQLNSMLDDAQWKQVKWGFGLTIDYSNYLSK